jgi:hypothetical protein
MSSKFKYPIDPKKIYTLEYDSFSTEVAGEEILRLFKKSFYLDKLILEMEEEKNADNN